MDRAKTNATGGASLERLAKAIREGFRIIEKRFPGAMDYDSVPLRGAMERLMYHLALLDPVHLGALVDSGVDPDIFAEWRPNETATKRPGLFAAYAKAWARLIYFALFSKTGKGRWPDEAHSAEFVFFAIHPKFVTFFLPVIDRLGRHRCALLCRPGFGVEESAARQGLRVCVPSRARLKLHRIGLPPRGIFNTYSAALNLMLWALGTLKRYRPRVMIFAEASSFEEETAAQAARALQTPTIRLQYGRAGILSPGYYKMPYDKMLMWGAGFVDRLRETSPDCQYVVTGSPLMDRFAQCNGSAEEPFFSDGGDVVAVISQPECANIYRQDYEMLVTVIDRVLSSADTVHVLVRLHPADQASDFNKLAAKWPQRLRVTSASDYPLEKVIGGSVLVVGLYSTVLSEAAAAGILPVVLRLGERHRIFPSPEDEGAAALATTADQAVSLISSLATNASARKEYKAGMHRFAIKYFGPMDGRATERIASLIENAA